MSRTAPRLTLIVAVTPSLGIGRAGTLPWPRIKSEMAYFSRVTKRVSENNESQTNAVIMGRKTWDSIPAKFRPLPGRLNVVISRQPERVSRELQDAGKGGFAVASLQEAIERLAKGETGGESEVDRAFVIGGAQIYAQALESPLAERILLTRIKQDYDCDTFFPIKLGSSDGDAVDWTLGSSESRDAWLGETEPGGDEWHVEMWTKKVKGT